MPLTSSGRTVSTTTWSVSFNWPPGWANRGGTWFESERGPALVNARYGAGSESSDSLCSALSRCCFWQLLRRDGWRWWTLRRRMLKVQRGEGQAPMRRCSIERMLKALRRRGIEKPRLADALSICARVPGAGAALLVEDFTAHMTSALWRNLEAAGRILAAGAGRKRRLSLDERLCPPPAEPGGGVALIAAPLATQPRTNYTETGDGITTNWAVSESSPSRVRSDLNGLGRATRFPPLYSQVNALDFPTAHFIQGQIAHHASSDFNAHAVARLTSAEY